MELVSGLTEKYDFLLLVYMFGMIAIQNKKNWDNYVLTPKS